MLGHDQLATRPAIIHKETTLTSTLDGQPLYDDAIDTEYTHSMGI